MTTKRATVFHAVLAAAALAIPANLLAEAEDTEHRQHQQGQQVMGQQGQQQVGQQGQQTQMPAQQKKLVKKIQQSKAIIVKVPKDKKGKDVRQQAQVKMLLGHQGQGQEEDIEALFNAAEDASGLLRANPDELTNEVWPLGAGLLGLGLGLALSRPYVYYPYAPYYTYYSRPYYYGYPGYGYYYYNRCGPYRC